MKIFSQSDPRYFKFLEALIKSVRFHGNENEIIIHLMDFNEKQKERALNKFKNDSKLMINFSSHEDFGVSVSNKTEFYRNSRTRHMLQVLESDPDNLLTLCANGLVFTDLSYIEDILKVKDFVFLERTKKVVHKNPNTNMEFVRNIEELATLVEKNNLDLDSVLDTTTGKVVLLGTHGIANNTETKKIIRNWNKMVESESRLSRWYSDMNLFVKAFIEHSKSSPRKITKETGWDLPRERNPFVDTKMISGNNIWFAKAERKFHDKRYLQKVKEFCSWEYRL